MRYVAIVALCGVLLAVNSLVLATSYTGSLTYTPPSSNNDVGGLHVDDGATGGWFENYITMSWTVTSVSNIPPFSSGWLYNYTFSLGNTDKFALSHLIIETTTGFSSDNIAGLSGASVDSIELQKVQSGCPNMPSDVYGIRFNPPAGDITNWSFSFYSDRAPVWGDFYAKDGGEPVNDAYNVGFITSHDTDPAAPPSDGTVGWSILRPDTAATGDPPGFVIPEPVTLVGVFVGIAGVGGYIRRRRKSA